MTRTYKKDHKINNKGTNNPNAKLTDQQVNEIKLLRYTEKLSHRILAMRYGCSHTQIRRILNNQSRNNV